MANRRLTIDLIVRAATRLLDQGSSLSMRTLAADLGVDPMAVYRHLPSKSALMHAVLEALTASIELPPPIGDWRERVRVICRAYRDVAHRHPGAFRVLYPYPKALRSELPLNEAFYAALLNAGLDERDAALGATMLLNFAAGFGLDEVTGWLDASNERMSDLAELSEESFPATRRVLGAMRSIDPDVAFEFGLDILINGLAEKARPL